MTIQSLVWADLGDELPLVVALITRRDCDKMLFLFRWLSQPGVSD
ncbi:MAG TPA: hypothetical protein P5307_27520 [Pirellulaceae bacterium]|nr:hypothetical protein [Pirellulaceae bacterium]